MAVIFCLCEELKVYVEIYPIDYVSDYKDKELPDDYTRIEDKKNDIIRILGESPLNPGSITVYEEADDYDGHFVCAYWEFKIPRDPEDFEEYMDDDVLPLLRYLQDSFECVIFV